MQVRCDTGLTSEEYVKQEGWRSARLERCPFHPAGGCGISRHGSYPRVEPPGARIARCYCSKAGVTISLLPDCLASRLSSTMDELEQVVTAAESAPSLEAAAALRPEIELPGAVRWIGRRVRQVHAVLTTLIGLQPVRFAGCESTLKSFRARLGVERVLSVLREVAFAHLAQLPPPFGFGPRSFRRSDRRHRLQHEVGPDPSKTTR